MWQPLEIFSVYTTLSLKLILWKTKTIFKKLEYGFLVQSTMIKCEIFPHKTALPQAIVKTDRMESTKWTYYKGRSFASNYLIFLKALFQSENLFKRVD